jgi:hypothetical protein
LLGKAPSLLAPSLLVLLRLLLWFDILTEIFVLGSGPFEWLRSCVCPMGYGASHCTLPTNFCRLTMVVSICRYRMSGHSNSKEGCYPDQFVCFCNVFLFTGLNRMSDRCETGQRPIRLSLGERFLSKFMIAIKSRHKENIGKPSYSIAKQESKRLKPFSCWLFGIFNGISRA